MAKRQAFFSDDKGAPGCFQRAQTNFYGDFGTILAPSADFQAKTHGPILRLLHVLLPFFDLFARQPLWQQHLDGLPDHLLAV